MVRGKQKGDCSINDDHNITVKGEELYCKKVFFHFLLINQVQQLQHAAKYMSKSGNSTVTPFYLEILKQKFQTLTE